MVSREINRAPSSIWRNPIHFVACGFGIGAMPIIPGTFGTALGVVIYLMLAKLSLLMYLLITVILSIACVWLTDKTNADFGTQDHPAAVSDEVIGYLVAMIAVPPVWWLMLLSFVLFRIFDIWKPWPISWLDREIHGGVGVVLDDAVAGLFSLIIVQIVMYFFWY